MQRITYKGTQMCLAKIFLNKKWCDFKQLKRTEKTDEEGKWFLIYHKTQFDAVIKFINVGLPELYKQVLPKYKYEDHDTPIQKMSRATKTQMSYAAVLKHKIAASNP
eukprot:14207524-Ditylum_brightwellii.AAC.1